MAKKDFGVDLDLNGNQLLRARYHNSATAPAGPEEGQVYFNTSDQSFYGWDGTDWIDLSFDEITSYKHVQSIPSDIWTINHNLGFYPNISIVDSSGRSVEGDINYIDMNTVEASFAGAFAGEAYLS